MLQTLIDELNAQVSRAIYAAENDHHTTPCEQHAAFARVSELEEAIAELVPATQLEGALARRGAVRAAVNAMDCTRAKALVERYIAERVDETLQEELKKLLLNTLL